MRKAYLLFSFLLLCQVLVSQKLEENKIDEFTKHIVKRTSWEIAVQNFTINIFLRVSKIDSIEYIDMKMMKGSGKVFAIREGDKLMFMLDNDSVISVSALTSEITCTGCGARGFSGSGAPGIKISFVLDEESHNALKTRPIKKIRIYTTDGYLESETNKRRSSVLQDLIPLVE